MIKFDWNILHQFKKIVDSRTIDSAISQYHISRSTISRIFIKIEELFNNQVVKRYTKSNIQLSALGKMVLYKTNNIIESIEELLNKSKTYSIATSLLLIGSTQDISTLELSEKINTLRSNLGKSAIHIKTHYTELADAVTLNNIVIYPDVKYGSNIIQRKIKDYEFGFFASKKYLNENLLICKISDLLKQKIISYAVQKDFLFSGSNKFITALLSPYETIAEIERIFSLNANSTMSEFTFYSEGLGIACIQTDNPIGEKLGLIRILPKYSYK